MCEGSSSSTYLSALTCLTLAILLISSLAHWLFNMGCLVSTFVNLSNFSINSFQFHPVLLKVRLCMISMSLNLSRFVVWDSMWCGLCWGTVHVRLEGACSAVVGWTAHGCLRSGLGLVLFGSSVSLFVVCLLCPLLNVGLEVFNYYCWIVISPVALIGFSFTCSVYTRLSLFYVTFLYVRDPAVKSHTYYFIQLLVK